MNKSEIKKAFIWFWKSIKEIPNPCYFGYINLIIFLGCLCRFSLSTLNFILISMLFFYLLFAFFLAGKIAGANELLEELEIMIENRNK
jgi:hypothetical protein